MQLTAFQTIIPDYLNGDAVPADAMGPGVCPSVLIYRMLLWLTLGDRNHSTFHLVCHPYPRPYSPSFGQGYRCVEEFWSKPTSVLLDTALEVRE